MERALREWELGGVWVLIGYEGRGVWLGGWVVIYRNKVRGSVGFRGRLCSCFSFLELFL